MRTSDSIEDGDRPATEIEITPDMLRAGAAVAACYVDMEWEAMRDSQRNMILSRVYRAMHQAGGESAMSHEAKSETDRNYEAFVAALPTIPANMAGKFALMHDLEIVEFFDSPLAATVAGFTRFGQGHYSVQEVAAEPEHLGFYSYVGGAGQC